jgi:hypothetical protein
LSFRIVRSLTHEHADAPNALALLRSRGERPNRRAAEQRDELAPFQFIELHPIPTWWDRARHNIELAAGSQGYLCNRAGGL